MLDDQFTMYTQEFVQKVWKKRRFSEQLEARKQEDEETCRRKALNRKRVAEHNARKRREIEEGRNEMVRDILEGRNINPRSVVAIVRRACQIHNADLTELMAGSHGPNCTAARWDVISQLYLEFPDMSLRSIAYAVGLRHHNSVFHAVKEMGIWTRGRR